MKLAINKPSKIEFSLVIAGTQTKPTEVRIVLGDSAKLSFVASTDDGVNYTACVTPVREFVSSICNFAIEVLFGDKIFVPVRRQITVEDDQVVIQVIDNSDPVAAASVPAVEVPVSTRVELPPEPVKEIPPMELPIAIPTEEENKPVEIIAVEEKKFSLTKALAEASRPAEAVKSVELPKAKPMTKLAATKTKIEVPKLFETKPVQGIETDKTAVAKSIFADAPVVVEEKKEKVVKKKVVENVNAFVTFKKIKVVYL